MGPVFYHKSGQPRPDVMKSAAKDYGNSELDTPTSSQARQDVRYRSRTAARCASGYGDE